MFGYCCTFGLGGNILLIRYPAVADFLLIRSPAEWGDHSSLVRLGHPMLNVDLVALEENYWSLRWSLLANCFKVLYIFTWPSGVSSGSVAASPHPTFRQRKIQNRYI